MNLSHISLVMFICILLFLQLNAYRNLVVPGLTTAMQSSTYQNFGADRSIDGQPTLLRIQNGSCSHTGLGQMPAWLRISLGKVFNIKEVKFWYRNEGRGGVIETSRLHYYSMYYLSSVNNSWIRCYRDETPFDQPISMPSTVPCQSKTTSIQFYKTEPSPIDRPYVFLEICEVEIYGCDVNQYGEYCTNCSERCSECDVVNGCASCYPQFTGSNCELCQPGYMGDKCDTPCSERWYGQNCSLECSPHCLDNSTCAPVNGVCLKGCYPGYNGSTCMEECTTGTYGLKCEGQCSGNCYGNQTCNSVTGYCDSGCSRGWEGPRCLRPCKNGTFGENCANNCSGHCYQNQTCDRFDGTCPSGCDPGWTGNSCDKGCPTGRYGRQCNNTCDKCLDQTCNTVSGLCQQGCIDGWTGDKCEEVCSHGYFGRQCQIECGKCQTEGCYHVNGSCDRKCQDAAGQNDYGFFHDGRKNIGFYVATSILAILLVISVSVNILLMQRKIEARNIRLTENTQTPKSTISENFDNPTEVTVSTNYDNPTEVTDSTNYDILSFSGEKSEYTALKTLQQKSK